MHGGAAAAECSYYEPSSIKYFASSSRGSGDHEIPWPVSEHAILRTLSIRNYLTIIRKHDNRSISCPGPSKCLLILISIC